MWYVLVVFAMDVETAGKAQSFAEETATYLNL